MALSFMLCYVPQIFKIRKNKSSKDVSLALVLICVNGYISGLVYIFLTTFVLWVFLNYIAGLIMSSVLLWYWFKYKN